MMQKKVIVIGTIIFLLVASIFAIVFFREQADSLDKYVGKGEECQYINYFCSPGTDYFFVGIGCGCR